MNKLSEENTAKYYDIVYRDWIPKSYTEWELDFLKKFIQPGGNVLDVGCGSGRHLIPLSKMGYRVTGVEPLHSFVTQLKQSNPEILVINEPIKKVDLGESFDLIISMWNAFHQLAFNFSEGLEVITKLQNHLNTSGHIVFSLSPLEEWDVKDYEFTHSVQVDGKKFLLTWTVDSFDKEENIVVSRENIKVFDDTDKLIDDVTANVIQKYWSESELGSLCAELGLTYTKYPAQKGFYDNYYVISKI